MIREFTAEELPLVKELLSLTLESERPAARAALAGLLGVGYKIHEVNGVNAGKMVFLQKKLTGNPQ